MNRSRSSVPMLGLLFLIGLVVSSCSSSVVHATAVNAGPLSSPYLKEILLGRCYDMPPTTVQQDADDCPAIVASLMNVLESHLDAEIVPSDFEAYLNQANFVSPHDHAMILLKFFANPDVADDTHPAMLMPLAGLVTPESTPGGALLRELVFCGVDQRQNCSIEKSKAFWSFWQAAYAAFATHVTGNLQIVLENEHADVQFLLRSAIPQLTKQVTSVTLYDGGRSCNDQRIVDLKLALLEHTGMKSDLVTCKDFDMEQFYLDNIVPGMNHTATTRQADAATNGDSNSQEQDHNDKNKNGKNASNRAGGGNKGFVFLLMLLLGIAIYCLHPFKNDQDYYNSDVDPETIRHLVKMQYERAQEQLFTWLGHVYPRVKNIHQDEVDRHQDASEAVSSEGSPLVHKMSVSSSSCSGTSQNHLSHAVMMQ